MKTAKPDIAKKKKDFKLREDIVLEFERLAPSGKQTAIIESLMSEWVVEQKRKERVERLKKSYQRISKGS